MSTQAVAGLVLRRVRFAAAGGFFTQGLVFISLTTRLPVVRQKWRLSSVEMSLLLLMMVLLAGVGSLAAEKLAQGTWGRRDSGQVLRGGLTVIAVCLPGITLAPSFVVFAGALAVYGVALGVVDASTNMQAVALEHRYGRPILPSFHGAWTLGGVIGSALTLATGNLSLGWAAWLGLVPLVACLARFLRRGDVPVADAVDVPWRPILLVGAALVLFYMVDTAASTWGPTYLDKTFSTPSQLVALATFPYLVASLVFRFAGDTLVARHGAQRVLQVGALVSAVALAVVVFAPSWPVAVLGFTLLGAGAAVMAPLSFSAAARISGGDTLDPDARAARVDAVIARFNQFNYVGALLGAVLTGLVGAGSLRYGFALPMVLILGVVPLARAFGGRMVRL
ncbi:MAG: MFS transporter [Actinomycetota bacterium]|nr:MFS transporter [Actinomycetota bacterium]